MTLGQKIAQIRKIRNLSQRELATRLNIHPSMVTRWEKDQVQPKSSTLHVLAEALSTTTEELLKAQDLNAKSPTLGVRRAELVELFTQVDELDSSDQEALRAVLDAMLTKSRIQNVVSGRKSA